LSGIKTTVDLPWRSGVTKIALIIGDARPLLIGLIPSQIIADLLGWPPRLSVSFASRSTFDARGSFEPMGHPVTLYE